MKNVHLNLDVGNIFENLKAAKRLKTSFALKHTKMKFINGCRKVYNYWDRDK